MKRSVGLQLVLEPEVGLGSNGSCELGRKESVWRSWQLWIFFYTYVAQSNTLFPHSLCLPKNKKKVYFSFFLSLALSLWCSIVIRSRRRKREALTFRLRDRWFFLQTDMFFAETAEFLHGPRIWVQKSLKAHFLLILNQVSLIFLLLRPGQIQSVATTGWFMITVKNFRSFSVCFD